MALPHPRCPQRCRRSAASSLFASLPPIPRLRHTLKLVPTTLSARKRRAAPIRSVSGCTGGTHLSQECARAAFPAAAQRWARHACFPRQRGWSLPRLHQPVPPARSRLHHPATSLNANKGLEMCSSEVEESGDHYTEASAIQGLGRLKADPCAPLNGNWWRLHNTWVACLPLGQKKILDQASCQQLWRALSNDQSMNARHSDKSHMGIASQHTCSSFAGPPYTASASSAALMAGQSKARPHTGGISQV